MDFYSDSPPLLCHYRWKIIYNAAESSVIRYIARPMNSFRATISVSHCRLRIFEEFSEIPAASARAAYVSAGMRYEFD